MKNPKVYFLSILFLSIISFQAVAKNSAIESELYAEARNIVKTFAGTLKPKLKQAIKTGGLEHAIDVCSTEAPKIASALSKETGWSVKRVSLKPRNTSNAEPDDFERKILEQMNDALIKGEQASVIEHSEIVDNKFKYMKAQVVEGVCLGCHGKVIPADVIKAIKARYPKDIARGYSLGDIRGAFSLVKDLN